MWKRNVNKMDASFEMPYILYQHIHEKEIFQEISSWFSTSEITARNVGTLRTKKLFEQLTHPIQKLLMRPQ